MVLVPSSIHASKQFHGRAIERVSMIYLHNERKEMEMRGCMDTRRRYDDSNQQLESRDDTDPVPGKRKVS